MPDDAWTPYGLERIRIQYLRRRRLLSILVLLALLGLAFLVYSVSTTTNKEMQIFRDGKQVGGDVQLQAPSAPTVPDHVTVGLTPGQVTRVDTGSDASPEGISRASLPRFDRAEPYDWTAYLVAYGPYLLVGLAAYWLAKRRGKHDELNFGVYKGAMPLEMITASHEKAVFTRRLAKSSVFGKGRADHLPREAARAQPESE